MKCCGALRFCLFVCFCVVHRNEIRTRNMPQLPVPPPPQKKEYHYAESLWCTYIISVAASWVAELGMTTITIVLLFFFFLNNRSYRFVLFSSDVPAGFDQNTSANSGGDCEQKRGKINQGKAKQLFINSVRLKVQQQATMNLN